MIRLLHLLLLLSSYGIAYADEVEFPEEELARESVLPVFENPKDVLNRHVVTSKRFEVGLGGGLEVDEPFYNDIIYSLHTGYHLTDLHAINVDALIWGSGLSSYGNQLKTNQSIGYWDPTKAPHPLWGMVGNYEFTAYYGKISITKQTVMNLNLFFFGGPLYIGMQGYSAFGGDVGLGQNFYLTRSFSLRLDYRMLIFQGPNAATQDLRAVTPAPSAGAFQTRIFYNSELELMAVFLL